MAILFTRITQLLCAITYPMLQIKVQRLLITLKEWGVSSQQRGGWNTFFLKNCESLQQRELLEYTVINVHKEYYSDRSSRLRDLLQTDTKMDSEKTPIWDIQYIFPAMWRLFHLSGGQVLIMGSGPVTCCFSYLPPHGERQRWYLDGYWMCAAEPGLIKWPELTSAWPLLDERSCGSPGVFFFQGSDAG